MPKAGLKNKNKTLEVAEWRKAIWAREPLSCNQQG